MKIVFKIFILLFFAVQAQAASNSVRIYDDGTYRYIESNGIANHSTGRFPNKGNPNKISIQNHKLRMPLNPQFATKVTPLGMGKFGMAINGIPFEPAANEFWNNDRNSGLQYEALSEEINLGIDKSNAHVQPTGMYHYHGLPTGLLAKLPEKQNVLVGYAADGFPIYVNNGLPKLYPSFFLGAGKRRVGPDGNYDGRFTQDYLYVAGRGDLDECNGRIMISPEYPKGIYSYFITETFPYIPRCFKGVPDASFSKRKGSPPGPRGAQDIRSGRRPPPPDGRRPALHHRHP